MGIRINKVIGYGLTDVIADTENWNLKNDQRFNPAGYFGMDVYEQEDKFDLPGFRSYLEKRIETLDEDDHDIFDMKLLKHQIELGNAEAVYHSVIYDMEFGESEVMVFVPPTSTKLWKRRDDMIDYYEPANRLDDGGSGSSLIKVDRPLYPWDSYVNIKTGVPVRLDSFQHQMYNHTKNHGYEKLVGPESILHNLNIESEEEFHTCIVPIIPTELIELIKYLRIFTDEKDIYQLRPMIYGYWS